MTRASHNAALIADALTTIVAGLITFAACLGLMALFMPTEIGAVVDSIFKAVWGFTWRAGIVVAGVLCVGAAMGSRR